MINCKDILEEVEFSYQTERSKRDYNVSLVKETLLKNKDYMRITESLSNTLYEWNKAEFYEDNEKAAALEAEINVLKQQKKQYEDSYDLEKIMYRCPICKDTGFINDKRCNCYYKAVTKCCYKELNQDQIKFSTFEDDTLSQKNGTQELYNKLSRYADNFSQQSKNIIFTGKTGTGKSFLAQALADRIESHLNVVIYITASQLNNIAIENMYASPKAAKISDDILKTCDFLVIDDLGSEKILAKITLENLYNIISDRLQLKKPFLITTNLTLNELLIRYGDRIFSRLTSKNTITVAFDGADLRKEKL